MELVTRKNPQTGAEEQWVMADATLISCESTSRKSKANNKPYGFFNATIGGKRSSGIAWNGVVAGMDTTPGTKVQVEALRSDLAAGVNKNWKISLPSTEALSTDISDFLATL